ncbi:MAG: hypothetical protein U9Q69_03115 [Nanoarchaeota archaeon]|nr:hypothetical protein [Nanoarchaeota archaeon]
MLKIIKEFKKNKSLAILLFLILALGIFLRLNDFNQEGFWNDDATTIPTALAFFYPHSEYPGLLGQGEPAFGNFIIGCGCMLSKNDFSNVTSIPKNFFVGRDALLGEAMTNSTFYCHLPMYIFGILFLIIISIFSLKIIGLKASLYPIAFFSFFPFLLVYSRWLHVDIIMYTFAALGTLFLWLGYEIKKDSKKEFIYFGIAFLFFAFAFATKLPAALLAVFGGIIIIQKYWHEILYIIRPIIKKLDLNFKFLRLQEQTLYVSHFIKIIVLVSIVYILSLLPAFEFKLSNLFAVINQYRTTSFDFGGFGFNTNFLYGLKQFLYNINSLDFILILFAIATFIIILMKKNKSKNEKFLIAYLIFGLLVIPFSTAFALFRVIFIFIIPFIIFMGLIFSKKYIFKSIKHWNFILIIFLIIYIILQFSSNVGSSPYFIAHNSLLCKIADDPFCNSNSQYGRMANKIKYNYLKENLKANETYFVDDPSLYYYIRQGQSYPHYYFREAFKQEYGRSPTLEEYIALLQPYGRKIRYVLLFKEQTAKDFLDFMAKYQPNEKLKMDGKELIYVYDTVKLIKKVSS